MDPLILKVKNAFLNANLERDYMEPGLITNVVTHLTKKSIKIYE